MCIFIHAEFCIRSSDVINSSINAWDGVSAARKNLGVERRKKGVSKWKVESNSMAAT